jgi:hypothetical protein
MFFRLSYTLKPINLGTYDSLQLAFKGKETDINIYVNKITKENLVDSQILGDFLCVASMEKSVSKKQSDLFEAMNNETSTGLKQRIGEITIELHEGIYYAAKVIRWRRGIPDYDNFIRSGSILGYSFDNKIWKSCIGQLKLTVEFGLPIQKFTDAEEYSKLLKSKIAEPLGHELFCEAWSQRKTSPRSSLVIGIAAAETGFKECTVKLMPDASWLISNSQSPPLYKMLTEYLPTFHAIFLINGKVLSPPENVLKHIKDGITIRNKLVHGNAIDISNDKLENVLRAVRDILYLLDFYSGQKWAVSLISAETQTALVEESKR